MLENQDPLYESDSTKFPRTNSAFAYLMSLPVNDENRPKLSDQVRLSVAKLAIRAKKFCSAASVFATSNPIPVDERPLPTYAEWLRKACAPRTLTSKGDLRCPNTCDWKSIDDYIAWFDRANNLRGDKR